MDGTIWQDGTAGPATGGTGLNVKPMGNQEQMRTSGAMNAAAAAERGVAAVACSAQPA